MSTIEHIQITDLRGIPEEKLEFLRRESVRRGIPFSRLLGELVEESSDRLRESAKEIAAKHKEAA